jgi:hypothetical protein
MSQYHGYFPKSNFNKLLAIFSSIAFVFILTFLIYPNYITIPEFNIDQTKITNQPIIFESLKNKFWIEESGIRTYSKEKNGLNVVNLGRKSGKKNYTIGGYSNIGPLTMESKSSYTLTLERDYTTIEGDVAINRYYPKVENPNYTYNVNTKGRKYLKLEDSSQVLFESTSKINICGVDTENSNIIKCPFKFQDDQTKINLFLSDDIGNRVQIASDQYVSMVPNISFNCDYKNIELNKSISCNSNKKAKVTYLKNNESYDVTPQKEQIIPIELVDGSNLIQFSILDEHGFTSKSELKLNVQMLKNI